MTCRVVLDNSCLSKSLSSPEHSLERAGLLTALNRGKVELTIDLIIIKHKIIVWTGRRASGR